MTIERYDQRRDHWSYLRDSYYGGINYAAPSALTLGTAALSWSTIDESGRPVGHRSRARSYLVPHEGESDEKFAKRCALAACVNITGLVVKAYAEGVTNGIQRELEPLAGFVEDVDRSGSTWGEVVEQVATWSSVYGFVATIVDAPAVDVSGMSEAERSARRIAPYVVVVHPSAIVAVECVDGRLTLFAYVSTPYRSELTSNQGEVDVDIRVWRATTAEQPGGWEVRSGSVNLSQSIGDSIDALPLVSSGPLAPALAGEIPVTFCYYERDPASECPMGLSLVADVADAQRSIYNRLSWIDEIDSKAAFPFLAIPLAGTGGQLDDATRIKVGSENALGFSANAGAPSFIEPSGTSQRVMREQVIFAFQWAMRTAGLELAADSSAQVQSGEALRIRSRDFESRAKRFARNLQRWEMATLRLLATMAGKPEAIDSISVTYPKRITLPDAVEDLNRALAVLTAPVEVGVTARRAAVMQLIGSGLALPDDQLSVVGGELDAIYGEDLATSSAKLSVDRLRAENEARGLAQVADNAINPQPVEPVTIEAQAPAPTADTTVQDLALNGAQVSSLLEIITAVSSGTLPAATAREVIASAFPSFDAARIDRMLSPLSAFVPAATPQAPAAPPPALDTQPSVTDGQPA